MSIGFSLSRIVGFTLSVALSLAILDVGLPMLSATEERFHDAGELLILLAASSLIFLIVTTIWFTLVSVVARLTRSTSPFDAIAAAAAVFLGVVLSIAALTGILIPRRPRDLAPFGFLILIAALAAIGIYMLLLVAKPDRQSRLVSGMLLAIPLLLFEGLGLVWVSVYRVPGVASLQWLLGLAVFTLLAATTVWAGVSVSRYRMAAIASGSLLFLIVFGAVIVLAGRRVQPEESGGASGESRVHKIFLITVDAMRADQLLGSDGPRPQTPNLDWLADRSLVFRQAVSEAPWTLPAFSSIMSGLPVAVHGATESESRFPRQIPTLAGHLQEAGFSTVAIGNNPMLRNGMGLSKGFSEFLWYPKNGWGRSVGGEVIQTRLPQRMWNSVIPTTEDLTTFAIEIVQQHAQETLFVWLHHLDPHLPYSPREPPDPVAGPSFDKVTPTDVNRIRGGQWAPTSSEQDRIKALYQAEIEELDWSLGRFLRTLRDLGLFEDSLIVLTSDHGEEFFEHGGFEHGHSLYQELLRVPLLIKLPGQTDREEIASRVSNRAVMPTVLDIVGVEPRNQELLPPSLLTLRSNPGEANNEADPIFFGGPLYYGAREGVIFKGFKYLTKTMKSDEELYDLSQDPYERDDLANSEAELLREARLLMDQHHIDALKVRSDLGIESEKVEMTEEAMEQLRSLGYVQ